MLRPRLNQELPLHARIVSRSRDMSDWATLKDQAGGLRRSSFPNSPMADATLEHSMRLPEYPLSAGQLNELAEGVPSRRQPHLSDSVRARAHTDDQNSLPEGHLVSRLLAPETLPGACTFRYDSRDGSAAFDGIGYGHRRVCQRSRLGTCAFQEEPRKKPSGCSAGRRW
jgi:hypothetical protein